MAAPVRVACSNAWVPGSSNAQAIDIYQTNRVMYRVVDANNKTYVYVGRPVITRDVTPPVLEVPAVGGELWQPT
jgi:hypothetical protein